MTIIMTIHVTIEERIFSRLCSSTWEVVEEDTSWGSSVTNCSFSQSIKRSKLSVDWLCELHWKVNKIGLVLPMILMFGIISDRIWKDVLFGDAVVIMIAKTRFFVLFAEQNNSAIALSAQRNAEQCQRLKACFEANQWSGDRVVVGSPVRREVVWVAVDHLWGHFFQLGLIIEVVNFPFVVEQRPLSAFVEVKEGNEFAVLLRVRHVWDQRCEVLPELEHRICLRRCVLRKLSATNREIRVLKHIFVELKANARNFSDIAVSKDYRGLSRKQNFKNLDLYIFYKNSSLKVVLYWMVPGGLRKAVNCKR